MATLRKAQPADVEGIRDVNLRAFLEAYDSDAEADLVDRLREACPEAISLVAESEGRVVGHILFTPVVIEAEGFVVTGMGLAPMSVLPECQRQGIGSQLVEAGLDTLRESGSPFVVVLGHPEYYPRFGFSPASEYGVTCEFENVLDETFMILVFDKGALPDQPGVAKYRPEFQAMTES